MRSSLADKGQKLVAIYVRGPTHGVYPVACIEDPALVGGRCKETTCLVRLVASRSLHSSLSLAEIEGFEASEFEDSRLL